MHSRAGRNLAGPVPRGSPVSQLRTIVLSVHTLPRGSPASPPGASPATLTSTSGS